MAQIATVVATVRGLDYQLAYNQTNDNWSTTASAPTTTSYHQNPDHTDHVIITVTDSAGNTAMIDATDTQFGDDLKLRVLEVTKPTQTFIYPTQGAFVDTQTPILEFRIDDEINGSGVDVSTLYLSIDGTVIPASSSNLTFTPDGNGYLVEYNVLPAITDGTHTVIVGISDFDGNASDRETITFTVASLAPILNITSPSEYETLTNQPNLMITGETEQPGDASAAELTVSNNGTPLTDLNITINADGTFSISGITLVEGTNTLEITATNRAGISTVVERIVVLDTVAPTVTGISITPNPVDVGALITITITAIDT